ncbi:MAG TPA: response regulator [Polyangiaceae bacterium]|nr:response regulator [Polyangiaceae bacterium]
MLASMPAPNLPSSIRVLNVNDDPSARYLATKMLRRAGFEVFEADTGMSAVRQARIHQPHLAVLDVRLPDISGLDVCRALKSDPDTASILVVQTSASFVTSANKAEGLSAGADAYLAQPFDAEELVATLHSLLRGRRQEAEARERANALTQADQRKDEFLAMLAHELRNPLSAILTAARLLQTQDGEHSPKLAATIERQAHHLASLVDDLLDISRITHGKIQLKMEPVDVLEAVRRAIDTVRSTFARHRHQLELHCCDGPLVVNADPVRLEQILCNLLTNAAKYTNEQGHVEVNVDRVPDSDRVRIAIKDDGIGLSSEDAEHIFDLFYQVDTSIARSQSGLGIGLTMVKRLIEMHGGSVSVRSEGRGRGAEFNIELPEIAPPSKARTPSLAPRALHGTRVLFVDDNLDACELMQMSLQMAGCVVTTAHDGGEAVRLGTERRFDVAVLDIGLPVLDGYQVAASLVETLGPLRPRLIALTGYNRAEDRGRAKRAGFDAHLVKPADSESLLRTINDVLQGARVRLG